MENTPQQTKPSVISRWRRLPGSLLGLLKPRFRPRQLGGRRAVVGGLLLLLMLAGGMGLWLALSKPPRELEGTATFLEAFESLDRGEYVRARHLAKKALAASRQPENDLGKTTFVLGAAMFHEAEDGWTNNQENGFLLASRYLSAARHQGLPEQRKSEGLYLLGKSLLLSGDPAAAIEPLQEALASGYPDPHETHWLLSSAYAGGPRPELDKALEHNAHYLAVADLSPQKRSLAQIDRCRLLFLAGQLDACRAVLDQVPTELRSGPDVLLLEGQLLLSEARRVLRDPARITAGDALDQAMSRYRDAIDILREIFTRDSLDKQATPAAMYLIGVCKAEMGEVFSGEALDQLTRTRKTHFESAEGLAAGLLEADLLRAAGRSEEAVGVYRLVLDMAGSQAAYNNPWVGLEDLKSRILAAYDELVRDGQYRLAMELLEEFPPLFSQVRTWELTAQTAGTWAESIEKSALDLTSQAAEPLLSEARAHHRHAGATWRKIAQARITTREYPEDLWNAASRFLLGRDYRQAAQMLEQYLAQTDAIQRPEALLGLGRAYLALAELPRSVRALEECIEFHARDAVVFAARIECGLAYWEMQQPQRAEELLRQNLDDPSLTPASREWRDSLFRLGSLLAGEQRYSDAIGILEEAVARYPDAPQALEATFTIAESYRQGAEDPHKRSRDTAVATVRSAHRQRLRHMLEEAVRYYSNVMAVLLGQDEQQALAEREQAMLRHCYFGKGAALFDLERFDEAIDVYSSAATRYQNEPFVLEAFMQIAHCYRRQQRTIEARGAVEQAKVVLKRLAATEDYTRTTNHTREEWIALLERYST